MGNVWYRSAMDALPRKGLDWTTDSIKAYPVGPAYVVDRDAHIFVAALGANVLGAPVLIANREVLADGVLDGDDLSFADLAAGAIVAAIVIAVDSGTPETSRLQLYFDTGLNLPFIADGDPLSVQWDNGPNRIAKV